MSLALCLMAAAAANWPVGYNNGVTAYRSNDFTSASTAFEQATASTDRTLQQRAYYNLGNTAYRLGEADPTKAQTLWERAVKDYETALALAPNDADAKFNRDFVKKKLEKLKKQQQKQQQNKQNQQNQQKQQNKQQEQKRDNQQQQEQQKQQEQSQSQRQKQDQQKSQKQSQPQPQKEQKPEESKQQEQQAQVQQLDKQEAKALLDNLRENERNWNFFPEVQMKNLKDSSEPAKDW
jgi:Ca-activated chloride channel family protein